MNKITLREAIERFPGLLDEMVTFGATDNVNLSKANIVSFQFCGDGNYRTKVLISSENEDANSLEVFSKKGIF